MRKKTFWFCMGAACFSVLWTLPTTGLSQLKPSTSADLESAAKKRLDLRASSALGEWPLTCIGPTVMGGRITDIDVDPRSEGTWYVAYASGGLFRTTTFGQSWTPLFDNQAALGIGDIAVSPANPDVLWVGTGECNSSRSSYAGAGVFRSTDAGGAWTHCGLTGTQHIARVVAHPTDPMTAWVAAIGPLYSPSQDRGVFRTTDGGKSWKKTLYVNDTTGVIDLVVDPANPNRLWASSWTRTRRAWEFNEGGTGSAVWRSEDGGLTWTKSGDGLPLGPNAGRIGLAVAPSDPNTLYAVMDNQAKDGEPKEDTVAGLTVRMFRTMDKQAFLLLDDAKLDSFLRGAGYPGQYSASKVKSDVRKDVYAPAALGNYFGDANDALFRTSIKGCQVYRSNDGGKSWALTHDKALNGVFFTYGYYFGQIRVSPNNKEEIYTVGVPLIRSSDGGRTWSQMDTTDLHGDHHGLWIHPKNPNQILLGTDGGLYLTYDKGQNWTHLNNLPMGQYYTVQVDMAKPFNVYGGLQDNGVYKGTSAADWKHNDTWRHIMGGDGMFAVPDTVDDKYVYTGFQFGNYYRLEAGNPREEGITPSHDIGQPPYRFNWRTPIVVSPHNHEVIYLGSQHVLRSLNQGRSFEAISGDLTGNRKPQGNVPYSTITALAESPLRFGQLWAGTDDGRVSLTTDGGLHWSQLSLPVPAGLWVSSLHPSRHDEKTAFATLNGYRNDHFKTYVYKTTDLGKTWVSLQGNLPDEALNVIVQDPQNPQLLYLGSDHGLYVSLDGGKWWSAVSSLPNVAVYDLVVHPRDQKLVVATHGRSLWIADVAPLQGFLDPNIALVAAPPTPDPIKFSAGWGKAEFSYQPISEPKITFRWWSQLEEVVTLTVTDTEGNTLLTLPGRPEPGYHESVWNLKRADGTYLGKGTYTFTVSCRSESSSADFTIE
jgi:photosystem II stability/assembly factor-like uncharacterized protein